jgi:GntR family transcriptional regulator
MGSTCHRKRPMPALTKKQTIIDDITAKIESGEYPPGFKLPSGTEMCAHYGVSRQVTRSAVDYLKAVGLVVSAPGSGVYVAQR